MVFKDDYFKLLFCKFDSFYDYNFIIKWNVIFIYFFVKWGIEFFCEEFIVCCFEWKKFKWRLVGIKILYFLKKKILILFFMKCLSFIGCIY